MVAAGHAPLAAFAPSHASAMIAGAAKGAFDPARRIAYASRHLITKKVPEMTSAMSALIDHMIAYYVAGPASELSVAPRFYPYGELQLIFEDKVSVAVRKFGPKVRKHSKEAGKAFIDRMIETGAWSTNQGEYGGSMHQFQADRFSEVIRAEQDANPIIQNAKADPDYWDKAFGDLVA
jgi:hypothetical protein